MQYGKCTNFGLCTKADTREAQSVPDGADFVCKECKRPLTAIGGEKRAASKIPVPVVVGVVLVMLLIGGGFYYFNSHRHSDTHLAGTSVPAPNGSGSHPAPLLRLSGSNTIGAQLAPALVEAWLGERGVTGIHRQTTAPDEVRVIGTKDGAVVAVEIKAHGSATAFTSLAAGTCDIGMASRKIKPQEAADLQSKGLGDLTSNADERVLGLDGVAVIVNESNPAESMTIQEVAAVFSGTAPGKNWHVYARDDKSGTYDTFKDRVLGNSPLVASAKRFEDSRALVSAVAQDRDGIGFVGLPYASGAKVLAISERGAAALIPNVNTVRTESYALSRRLYLYVPDNAKPEAREFARFALGPSGQDMVEKNGFVGQKVDVMSSVGAPANAPSGYVQLMPSADRLTVDFRFRTGSSQLDPKAVDDIKRVSAAMASQYSGRGVMLVGFADSTGSPAKNIQLSKDRAEAVAEQMKRQGVSPVFVTGFGQELPVADNSTPDGRERNRRVEVWIHK
jgi:phosphate transport system substrate-binding protein